jgi:hypothetical protein
MARQIQSQSARSQGAKTFVGLLANAIFWLVLAIVVPVESFLGTIPEMAPYAHWGPILFYALAFISFVRAVRSLQRLAAGRTLPAARPRPLAARSHQAADRKPAKSSSGLPVSRTPTVQRMR